MNEIREALRRQARRRPRPGAPFTAELLAGLTEQLPEATPPHRPEEPAGAPPRIWPGAPNGDAPARRWT